jgi:hypothetical protein
MQGRRLRILTWHVHGNYLWYLTQVPHDWYLVVDDARSPGRSGRSGTLPWGPNVHEVHVDQLRDTRFDAVLYQSRAAWEDDRMRLLSEAQRRLPALFLEHDPPIAHASDTRHFVDDGTTLLVHCTPFNALMWDAGRQPTRIVDHGVKLLAPARHSGELARGIVVVNNLDLRGRRLGHDIYLAARDRIPLDLVGIGADRIPGGRGSIDNAALAPFVAQYRFFFNPIRWTSLGLAIIEAMMVGLPVVGFATTELVTVIRNGENGFVDTRIDRLIEHMQYLLDEPAAARALGDQARRDAEARFGIERFVGDWMGVLADHVR